MCEFRMLSEDKEITLKDLKMSRGWKYHSGLPSKGHIVISEQWQGRTHYSVAVICDNLIVAQAGQWHWKLQYAEADWQDREQGKCPPVVTIQKNGETHYMLHPWHTKESLEL